MMQSGVSKFIDDMNKLGFDPTVEAELVIFEIIPVDGTHAGCSVQTGVSATELEPWPQTPPHWIHLPDNIAFPRTNCEASPKSGWLRHSRNLAGWGDAPPAVSWVSHVRAVMSQATS